jgi:hypothetical protein
MKACSSNRRGFFQCPFFVAYIVANYGCGCSCCSCNIRAEKEEEVATTQEHNKLVSKRNSRNLKTEKICRFQH